jgi:peptide/nickel transport system permease protein
MIGENLRPRVREFWVEFRRDKAGLVGVGLLVLFLFLLAFEPLVVPFPEGSKRWHDITYWVDNPPSAAPAWTNWFRATKGAVQRIVRDFETEDEESDGIRFVHRSFTYEYAYDQPPLDVIIRFIATGDIPTALTVARPDGLELELYRGQFTAGDKEPVRISVDRDAQDSAYAFLKEFESEETAGVIDIQQIDPTSVIFAEAAAGMNAEPRPLHGTYLFTLSTLLLGEDRAADDPYLVISGRVSGLLGTDNSKRDLWTGIVAGVKWALLIGLLTAFVSVSVGVIAGIASAYFRGWIEVVIQRVFEIIVNMPLLPVLIIIAAVFRLNIWYFMGIMCIYFWTGPVKTVYSMALQIKEETYIEASRAIGAKSGRIIFRHMVPLLVPYSFASMALYVPGAVVYEATVSLLGLGDSRIVTWGGILHDALTGGAVLSGLWWWVVPPGLLIALVGMTFAFVGFAMDKILHPKLRTR